MSVCPECSSALTDASVCSDVCSDSSDDRSVVLGFSAEAFFPSEGSETFSLPHAETPKTRRQINTKNVTPFFIIMIL